ncbi:MAG: preprotein translocase subunit SecG [Candidatus Omnitrophota bacterium]|nr:preprotein translocase subunit SecG [Candidatus Omnitrophota bacterium]
MYSILIVVHVIISLFLIAVILLQAGKGGGLSDTFGGSQMQNLFGTKSTTVLTKLTAVCAIGFIITCVTLAVMAGHKTRSILDNVKIPQTGTEQSANIPVTQAPQPEAQAPVAPAAAAPIEPAPQGGTQ